MGDNSSNKIHCLFHLANRLKQRLGIFISGDAIFMQGEETYGEIKHFISLHVLYSGFRQGIRDKIVV